MDDEGQYFAELFDDSGNRVEHAVACDGDTDVHGPSRATATVEAPGQIAWNWEWRPSGDAWLPLCERSAILQPTSSSRHRLRRRLTPARISAGGPFEQHLEWRRRSAPATLAVLTTMAPPPDSHVHDGHPPGTSGLRSPSSTSCGDRRTSGSRSRSRPFAASRSRVAIPGRSAPPRCDPRLARHVDADHALSSSPARSSAAPARSSAWGWSTSRRRVSTRSPPSSPARFRCRSSACA